MNKKAAFLIAGLFVFFGILLFRGRSTQEPLHSASIPEDPTGQPPQVIEEAPRVVSSSQDAALATQRAPEPEAVLPERIPEELLSDEEVSYTVQDKACTLVKTRGLFSVTYDESATPTDIEAACGARGYDVVQHNAIRRFMVLRHSAPNGDVRQAVGDLRTLAGVNYADWVYAEPSSRVPVIVTPEITIRTGLADAEAYAARQGFDYIRPLRGLPGVHLLRVPAGQDVFETVRRHGNDAEISWMEPNLVTRFQTHEVPSDPLYFRQWHLHGIDFAGRNTNAHIHVEDAWDITMGSTGIVVAVIDTGTEYTHPDLAANLWINPGEAGPLATNDVDDDGNGYVDDWRGWNFIYDRNNPTASSDYHGTCVAGLICAPTNVYGVVGVAPQCRFLPIRVGLGLDFTSYDDLAEALTYGAQYADVLNNSWGGFTYSAVLDEALVYAATNGRSGKGCAVFFSTGNEDSEMGLQASHPMTIAVGGSGYDDERVEYSNYGPELDVMAPTMGRYAAIWTIDKEGTNYGVNVGLGWQTCQYTVGAGVHTLLWEFVKDDENDSGWDSAWLDSIELPGGDTESFELGDFSNWPWTTGGDTNWLISTWNVDDGTYSARSGDVGHNDSTYLQLVTNLTGGDVIFRYYVSSEIHNDRLRFVVDGSEIERFSGRNGDADGDFLDGFSGTSAACPIAGGVGALLLSVYPDLTWQEVRQALRQSADKIGPLSYELGHNDDYGYGRVNAKRLLEGPTICSVPATNGLVGTPYAYDDDGQADVLGVGTINWQVRDAPSGFSINATNGLVTWTPQTGGYVYVSIEAVSALGTNLQEWYVHVPAAYYVNDDTTDGDIYCGAVGDDANNGLSTNTPKATVSDVLNDYRLGPGDTIYIDSGNYTMPANIMVTNSGAAGSFITFQGAGPSTVLDRGVRVGGSYVFHLDHANFIQIRDMTLRQSTAGVYVERANRCTVERVSVIDSAYWGIYIDQATNITLRQVAVLGSWADGIEFNGGHEVNLIESCTLAYNGGDALDIAQLPGSEVTLRNSLLVASLTNAYAVRWAGGSYSGERNLLYVTNGALTGYAFSTNCPTLADWQGTSLQDDDAIDDPPLLLATNRYTLSMDSPAIDAGTNQEWMSSAVDIDGNDRIVWDAVDIGADESDYGDGDPAVDITNGSAMVSFDTTAWDTWGTNNQHVFGTMSWTNSATGSNGTFVATASWGVTNIDLAEGTNVITVAGTNLVGVTAHDSVTITRGGIGTGEPVVDITNANQSVSYETDTITAGGTNNAHVGGQMQWSNTSIGGSDTLEAESPWTIADIPLLVGTNLIVVFGTNSIGDVDFDTWEVYRRPPGSGSPEVVVTSENEVVSYDTAFFSVEGTNNVHVIGHMRWTNALNGQAGTFEAETDWSSPGVLLDVGTNAITVCGSNAIGSVTCDSVTITRQSAGLEPPELMITTMPCTFSYDTDQFTVDGLNNAHTVGQLTWSNTLTTQQGTLDADSFWSIPDIPLDVGTNLIFVSGTNLLGQSTNDFVELVRGIPGTGMPIVYLTNTSATVSNDVTVFSLGGSNNANVIGTMWWTNELTGESDTFASEADWVIGDIGLSIGANTIWVYGSNSLNMVAGDTVCITRMGASAHYVALDGTHVSPYTNWLTAATSLQAAVRVAMLGAVIYVSNGTYSTDGGPTPGFDLMNRVALTNAITMTSMNGPEYTVIQGIRPGGPDAVRCAYVTNGAVLSGFTLRDGATRTNWALFDSNYEMSGGGVLLSEGGTVTGCTIQSCFASSGGGGVMACYGGTVVDSRVVSNTCDSSGGGISLWPTGDVVRCIVEGNFSAWNGGGLHCGSEASVVDSFIENNTAVNGGGVSFDMGGRLENSLVAYNTADQGGGGVYCMWGGLCVNCTIICNAATNAFGSGGGVYGMMGGAFTNSIIYFNEAASESNWNHSFNQGMTFGYCCTSPTNENMNVGLGCITNAPVFIGLTGQTYRLAVASAGIDAGDDTAAPATDIEGFARPADGDLDGTNTVDMGAYEYTPACYDTDGDRMPDGWEVAYDLDPSDASDASDDEDGDNMANINEYVADTVPTNSASRFAIDATVTPTGVVVHFTSSAARNYSLWRIDTLDADAWEDIGGQTDIPGTGGYQGLSDTNTTLDKRYYRVGVEVP